MSVVNEYLKIKRKKNIGKMKYFINMLNNNDLIQLLEFNIEIVKYRTNISKKVQLFIFNNYMTKNGRYYTIRYIKFIKKMDSTVQWKLVKQDILNIKYIKNPNEDVQLYVISSCNHINRLLYVRKYLNFKDERIRTFYNVKLLMI